MSDVEYEIEHTAARACRTLNNHINLIGNAIVYSNSVIPVTESNEKIIRSLFKDELGYYDSEKSGFNIHSHVINFVSHYEKKRRVTDNSKQLLSIISTIKDAIADFEAAKLKNVDDAALLKEEIADHIVSLATTIFESCFNFSNIAIQSISLFNNNDLLIQRLETSLNILNSLTETLKILDFDTMIELGASDKDLEKIISQKLTPIVNVCQYDLKSSTVKLEKKLSDCKQSKIMQKRSNIVDALYRLFTSKQELNSQLDHSTAPDVFYRVEKTELISRANLQDLKEESYLSEVSKKVLSKVNSEVIQVEKPILPDIKNGSETIVVEPEKLEVALENIFGALTIDNSHHNELSAVKTYEILDPGCDIDYWLVSVTNYYRNQFKNELDIRFVEEFDPKFTGNSVVTDVIISRIQSPQLIA